MTERKTDMNITEIYKSKNWAALLWRNTEQNTTTLCWTKQQTYTNATKE